MPSRIHFRRLGVAIILEDEFRLVVLVQNDRSGKGPSGSAAEAFEGPHFLVSNENSDFLGSKKPTGNALENSKAASFTMIGPIVFFQVQGSAIRTPRIKS